MQKVIVIDERGKIENYRIWSQEVAEERERILGLRDIDLCMPSSIGGYSDLRENEAEAQKMLADLRKKAAKYIREFRSIQRGHLAEPGQGGGCHYMPVAIILSNYGGHISANKNAYIVSHFCHSEGCERPYYMV